MQTKHAETNSHSLNRLPWEKFRDWIHCIAVVTFDLELGQTLEVVFPHHVKLTEEEKTNVCYLAFPDSNSGCMGDTQFHFRIRHNPTKTDLMNSSLTTIYNCKCPPALQINHKFINGYVYFRQVKDSSLRRGYFQKSVVILSKLPFINLFQNALAKIAPAYFLHGTQVIESVCKSIYQWPTPIPGELLNLPLLDDVFQILIPTGGCVRPNGSPVKSKPQIRSAASVPQPIVISSVHEPDLFQYLRPVLSHVHLLWELILTAEPLVVMSSVPEVCCNTVNALVNMIFPVRYCGDFRPYFTIHDTDFKDYTLKSTSPPPVILGVTNPFFAKTLQHWPHIIRMGNNPDESTGKVKKANNIKLLDSEPGVYTSYKPFLQKDKTLLKKIVIGMQSQRPGEVQTAILRRYLHELTESFMIPLERYLASLMPLHKNISPSKATPLPKPFNPEDFLATLDVSGPQLTTGVRGEWSGLYKRFFRSLNFSEWYNLRYQEAADKLKALHLEIIAETDVQTWISGRDEVEVVDLVLRLREQVCQTHLPISETTRNKLQSHVDSILRTLPDDLQAVLNGS